MHSIGGYSAKPLGLLMNRFQLWGGGPGLMRWLPLDIGRPLKSTLITLDIPGTPKPAFTPNDPDRFIAVFDTLLKR